MVQKLSGVMMQISQTIVAFQIWLDKSYNKFVSGKIMEVMHYSFGDYYNVYKVFIFNLYLNLNIETLSTS